MASFIEISDTGQKNVVSKGYLHSATENFKNAVAMQKTTSQFYMGNQYYKDIERKLVNIINNLRAKEDSFYRLFGINTGDSAKNAYAFNQLFSNSLKKYSVLLKMNSESFIALEEKNLLEKIQKITKYFQKECLNKNIDIDKILNPADIEAALQEGLKVLNVTYRLVFGPYKERKESSLRSVYSSSGKINTNYTVRYNKVFEQVFGKEVENENEQSAKKFLNSILVFLKPDEELTKIIKKSFNKVKKRLNFQVVDRNNRIGIVGEIQAQIFLDLLLEQMSDAPKSLYVGDLKDSVTNRQSPVDFLVGKFGIQVKNTTAAIENSTVKPFYDIKVQSAVSLDTFLSRLQSVDANEFKYLITNVAWLRNNGLDKWQRPSPLKFSDIPGILEYINNILATYSAQLLHTETNKIMGKKKSYGQNYGNTFFLLKGRKLIPVSLMVEGVLKATRLENQAESSGVGYFYRNDIGISNKAGKEVRLTAAKNIGNAVGFYKEKLNILGDMKKRGELSSSSLDYNGELLDFGAGLGNTLRDGLKIKVNYKFITQNINTIENLSLW